jgi:Asp-tRNA(Asn)/Glu-tRNA(Gln) amidotransferase A subunit family amidase
MKSAEAAAYWEGNAEAMPDDIAFLPATRLLALYRSKELSPVEAVSETLHRLERYEGALNAFVPLRPRDCAGAGAFVRGALAKGRAARPS